MPGSMHASAPLQSSGAANRHFALAAKGAKGGALGLVLALLFWTIYYQNLPNNLEGMAAGGPIVTANVTDRVVKVLMIVVSAAAIASQWSMARALVKNFNLGAAAVLALCVASSEWSEDSTATLLRCISLLNIFLVCFAITLVGWYRERFQKLVLTPLMLVLIASLVVGVTMPEKVAEIGTDLAQRGSWHGVTHGKNELGMMSSISVIICVNRLLAGQGRAMWSLAGAAIGATTLILSRSNTSELSTLLAVFAMFLLMRVPIIRQRYSTHLAVAIAGTILLYELVIQDMLPGAHTLLSPIRALTGKDATFSGRAQIWQIVKEHIQWRPWLGTGYGAYWLGPMPGSPSYLFVPIMYFYPSEAHNGYLDIVNDLGYVGLVCVILYIIFYIRQALELMRTDRTQGTLYLAMLFQQMVMNMSESEWFSRSSTFAPLILATLCLSRQLLDTRARADSGAGVGSPAGDSHPVAHLTSGARLRPGMRLGSGARRMR
jgi:O-antigen ligase